MLTHYIFYLANNKPNDLYSTIGYCQIIIETINYIRSIQGNEERMKLYLESVKEYYSDKLNPGEFDRLSETIDFIKFVIDVLFDINFKYPNFI